MSGSPVELTKGSGSNKASGPYPRKPEANFLGPFVSQAGLMTLLRNILCVKVVLIGRATALFKYRKGSERSSAGRMDNLSI